MRRHLFFLSFIFVTALGCNNELSKSDLEKEPEADGKNHELLTKVNASEKWFRAKKTKPLWAWLANADGMVDSLEAKSQSYAAGDFVCCGESLEVWPQAAEDLKKKYEIQDEFRDVDSFKSESGYDSSKLKQFVEGESFKTSDNRKWQKCTPRADNDGVMACQISESFQVEASWGKLEGKPQDYLLKNYSDKDTEFPSDVWIVDQKLFESTYQRVAR